MILFRPHRGGLTESMRDCAEVQSRAEIVARCHDVWAIVDIKPYGPDPRIGWLNTHIVIASWADGGTAPCGFTNGPLEDTA